MRSSGSSAIIVRWGGDEFLLVARDLSGDGLVELAERIRSRVASHVFEIGEGRVVRTTCSVGFACYPFFREQLDALSWEQVVREGTLRVTSSLTGLRNLVWEPPAEQEKEKVG